MSCEKAVLRCEFSLAFAPDELMSRDNASVRSMRCRRNVDCTMISLGLNLLHADRDQDPF
jgi:hypothetical protein